jgi:hypothetical protein
MSEAEERTRRSDNRWKAERAIVMQLLRDDRPVRWPVAELAVEVSGFDGSLLESGLARLQDEGVLHREEGLVWASRASRCLDELELIGL